MAKTSVSRRIIRRKDKNSSSGRAQAKGSRPPASRRYTPPVPREVRHSPRWYPWLLLSLLILGILAIIGNYASFLPASPSNWYTLGGLIGILTGALAATYYR